MKKKYKKKANLEVGLDKSSAFPSQRFKVHPSDSFFFKASSLKQSKSSLRIQDPESTLKWWMVRWVKEFRGSVTKWGLERN